MEYYSGDWYKITMTEVEIGTYFSNYVFNNGSPVFDEDQTMKVLIRKVLNGLFLSLS